MDVNKYLTESEVVYEADQIELKQVADAMTRYLLGDKKTAIAQLTKLQNKDLGMDVESGSKEYNTQYTETYKKILQAIK